MAKRDREQLKTIFDDRLLAVWERWTDTFGEGTTLHPFKDSEKVLETDMDSDALRYLYEDMAYVEGVHDAMGWSLENPRGPKSWSPRS